MSIVIPVAINGDVFKRLSGFFRNLPEDGSLTLSGFMEFAQHVVNYRTGLCSDVPDDPMMLYLWSLERGFLPIAMPQLEGSTDNQALTVRRMGYNLVLNVFMRDIFQVVHRLKNAGLIGAKTDSNQEEAVIIANTYSLLSATDVSFYTEDLSRRVFYPAFRSEGIDMSTPPLGHVEFDRQLAGILSRHESTVQMFKSELDKAMNEAMSND